MANLNVMSSLSQILVGASHTPYGPAPGSLEAVVGSFKSATTKLINQQSDTPDSRVWQRNYYEHIIRSERAPDAIRKYICDNPVRWELDRYHPDATGLDPQAVALWQLLKADV